VIEEEGHHISVFMYWACWKCFLIDPVSDKVNQKALRQRTFWAIIECSIAVICCHGLSILWPHYLLGGLVSLMYFRCILPDLFNAWIVFFAVYYFCCNFFVNLTDLLWTKQFSGYYHDEQFSLLFSYRAHQFILFALLSFISA
jgi:hypothetical protein